MKKCTDFVIKEEPSTEMSDVYNEFMYNPNKEGAHIVIPTNKSCTQNNGNSTHQKVDEIQESLHTEIDIKEEDIHDHCPGHC